MTHPTPPGAVLDALSDEQIEAIARAHGTGGWQSLADMGKFARAILAAAQAPEATCLGGQGECAYNGACMYRCSSRGAATQAPQTDARTIVAGAALEAVAQKLDAELVAQAALDPVSTAWTEGFADGQKHAAIERAMEKSPCVECGAMTLEEANTKCHCAGDKDDCHGCRLWPDDAQAPQAVAQPEPTGRDHWQQWCSDRGLYWRAPDAHGVNFTHSQALELLRGLLGVEVEITESVDQQARDAVIAAALAWQCERAPEDWNAAELAKAVIRMVGDWPGCEDCDFECGESCTPATVDQQLHAVDCHMAQLVHDKKLYAGDDFEPPEGWRPVAARLNPPKRCAAGRDGDCIHKLCPQNRDGEPHKSGRHCPLDSSAEGDHQ